jgi:hypothetical protein
MWTRCFVILLNLCIPVYTLLVSRCYLFPSDRYFRDWQQVSSAYAAYQNVTDHHLKHLRGDVGVVVGGSKDNRRRPDGTPT